MCACIFCLEGRLASLREDASYPLCLQLVLCKGHHLPREAHKRYRGRQIWREDVLVQMLYPADTSGVSPLIPQMLL